MIETAFAGRHTCDSPEWYTPPAYIDAAREAMGSISLDPASHAEANQIVQASRYFTIADDGLQQEWDGTVLLNPPGGQVAAFWKKFIAERDRFLQGIWIGYSLEQLQTLQQIGAHSSPLHYTMCVPKARIAFIENEAKKAARLAKIDAENELRRARGDKPKPRNEKADSPSHANYITYLGPHVGRFAAVFSRFGHVSIVRA